MLYLIFNIINFIIFPRSFLSLKSLTVWKKGTDSRIKLENVCKKISIFNAYKRAIKNWKKWSLQDWTDLELKTKKNLKNKKLKFLFSVWSDFFEKIRNVRLKNEFLEPFVSTVRARIQYDTKKINFCIWYKNWIMVQRGKKITKNLKKSYFRHYIFLWKKKVRTAVITRYLRF